MTASESIFKWLEENKDFFKAQSICKRVGIDKGNFSKYKNNKSIPEKYIEPIIKIIRPFGFDGFGVITVNIKKEVEQLKNSPACPENLNEEILSQIDEIKNEKIPTERNTTMGRKIWAKEQQQKIINLKLKIKP